MAALNSANSSSLSLDWTSLSATTTEDPTDSICPLQFIPTVQGSSPFAQAASFVFTVNFDTIEQAQAYRAALYKTHLQFVNRAILSAAAGPAQPSDPTTATVRARADELVGDQLPDADVAFHSSDDDSDLT